MIVTKVGEKKYVGKDVRHIALFRKTETEPVYNMVYQDGRGGSAMVKRFTVGGTTRDKEYVLTRGNDGSKVLYFSVSEDPAEIIHVKLRPKPKLRKTEFEFDLNEIEVKGRGSIGNILSRNLVARISRGSAGKALPKAEQLSIDDGNEGAVTKPQPPKNAGVRQVDKSSKSEKLSKQPVKKETAAGKQSPAVKVQPLKKTPVKPVKDEAPVTIEWDIASSPADLQKDRARILSEIEKKTEVKKKSQLKMDM